MKSTVLWCVCVVALQGCNSGDCIPIQRPKGSPPPTGAVTGTTPPGAESPDGGSLTTGGGTTSSAVSSGATGDFP